MKTFKIKGVNNEDVNIRWKQVTQSNYQPDVYQSTK